MTDKGLDQFLPASVEKSYFMLSDAERKVLSIGEHKIALLNTGWQEMFETFTHHAT